MRFLLLLLFGLPSFCSTFGSEANFTFTYLKPTDKVISFADSLSVLYDHEGKYNIDEILQMPPSAFTKPDFEDENTFPLILWSSFQLQNKSSKTWNAYLDFCNNADSVWVYTFESGHIIDEDFTGAVLKPYAKELPSPKNYLFISLDKGKTKTYYCKIRFNKWIAPVHQTHVFIHPTKETLHIITERYTWHSFYAGIMLLFCLVSTFLFFIFRESIFLYFAMLMFSFGVYFPRMNDVVEVFLSHPLLNDFVLHKHIIISSIVLSLFLFITHFIDLKKRWTSYHTLFAIYTGLTVVCPHICRWLIADSLLAVQITNLTILIWSILGIIPIIRFSLKQYPQARILLISIAILFLGSIISLLGAMRILPDIWIVRYGIQIGLILFSGILFYALFDRITTIKSEKMHFEELDHLKSRFFANISHEFRTPLTLVMGPIQQVLDKQQNETDKNLLNVAHHNAQRLLQLINQLLDLSKLEAGKMELKAKPLNFVKLLKGITMSFESLAVRKNIQLHFINQGATSFLYLDKDKVEKIFYNLLSNAFKFTPEQGEITVAIAEQKNHLEISIKDNGIGISASRLPFIFNRFFQVDSSETREQEGTGIGLALVKELVQLHKGKIEVQSEEGEGTTFTLQFPKGKAHLKESDIDEAGSTSMEANVLTSIEILQDSNITLQPYSKDSNKKSKKLPIVLVIEDNPDVRAYIRQYLVASFQVLEAVNGQEGIDKALEHLPDLVISDVMMPKKNGYEVCRTLKTNERTSHIPVILLTAKAAQEEKLQGLETGADDYLVKPFDTKELEVRVRNLIELRHILRKRFSEAPTIEPEAIQTNSVDKAFLEKVCSIVEAHLGDEQFGAEVLASSVNMSRVHLNRKLKALTDETANKFIRSFRLQKAMKMLQQQEGNVSEVAFETGFGSTAYFVKCFREKYGQTPGTLLNE
ncbi:MAG: ATP-binding protein [Chitinophagales bacterium]